MEKLTRLVDGVNQVIGTSPDWPRIAAETEQGIEGGEKTLEESLKLLYEFAADRMVPRRSLHVSGFGITERLSSLRPPSTL